MAWTFDTATNIGKVRALCGDTEATVPFLSDEEIQVFLDLEDGSLYAAAATACLAMASKTTLILKKIELLDLKTDGPAVSKELRELSKTYRETEDAVPVFEIAAIIKPPFQWDATVYGLPDEAENW